MFRPLFVLLLCGALSAQAQTTFHTQPATPPDRDAAAPHLAVSPGNAAALAYTAVFGPIPEPMVCVQHFSTTVEPWPTVWTDPVGFGPGGPPVICWTREGWLLAFTDGIAVQIFQGDLYGTWDPIPVLLFPGGEVMGLDLKGDAAAGPDARAVLVIEESLNPPIDAFRVRRTELTAAGWSPLETVAADLAVRPSPRLTLARDGDALVSTVWYLADDSAEPARLTRRVHRDGAWQPAEPQDDAVLAVQGEFAVALSADGAVDVLGLGMQPTCPCGSIHHLHRDAAGAWSPARNLTAHSDAYDWPMSPCLAPDPDGTVHAFWTQLGSDDALVPHRRLLEYRVLSAGVWNDEGDDLDAQPPQRLGPDAALAVSDYGRPVLAWTRRDTLDGTPQPQMIWIARVDPLADAPPAAPALTLDAHPSPFNPRTTLTLRGAPAGPVTVTVHDPRGRVVRVLRARADGAESVSVTWDGRDQAGRDAPAGVYTARAASGSRSSACKLTLLR